MDEMVAWTRAQLDADERVLAGSGDIGWLTFRAPDGSMDHTEVAARAGHPDDDIWIVAGREREGWTSVEVVHRESERLADIRAKRKILDVPAAGSQDPDPYVVKLLALPYAGRPGYRDEWKP